MDYTVDMVALRAEDAVNVEISQTQAAMKPGETLKLSAQVIPSYADDLRVSWSSGDATVAAVDENGLVTAMGPGACDIVCADCAGHTDTCRVTVGK